MSLQQTYQRFLASPNAAALAPDASLHYITTARSVESPDAIVQNLLREQKQIKKRADKTHSSVEAADALVLEVETEVEFATSGHYLPGLDETFIADQAVTFLIIHFVHFQNGLIRQIRLYWDQSALLKQLNVIGRSGRNWPIQTGQDQCKLINKCVSALSSEGSVHSAPQSNGNGNASSSKTPATPSTPANGRSNSSHAMRDPHASLHLHDAEDTTPDRPIAPRSQSSYRPPARDLTAIIGQPTEDEPVEVFSPPKARSQFSRGQTYELGQEGEDEEPPTPKPVQKVKKVDPKKYTHFEFGNGEDAPTSGNEAAATRKVNQAKHASSWNFEDFVTPEKRPIKNRPDDVRHFDWNDDNCLPSPVKTKPANRNAETHFSIKDDSPAPLSNVSNIARVPNHNSVSHFEIADDSPKHSEPVKKKELGADRQAAIRQQQSRWNAKDDSDDEAGGFWDGLGAEKTTRGIAIAGNGQGTRKTAAPNSIYENSSPKKENVGRSNTSGNKKQTEQSAGNFWDF